MPPRLASIEVDAVKSSNDDSPKGAHGVAAGFRVWDALNPESELWAPARQDGVTTVVVAPSWRLRGGSGRARRDAAGSRCRDGAQGSRRDGGRSDQLRFCRGERPKRGAPSTARPARGRGGFRAEPGRVRIEPAARSRREEVRPGRVAACPGRHGALDRPRGACRGHPGTPQPRARTIRCGSSCRAVPKRGRSPAISPRRRCRCSRAVWATCPQTSISWAPRSRTRAGSRKAGVAVAITTGGGNNFFVRDIRQHAGNAIANGLPWDEALRAVTLTPAEIFGVADSMGSAPARPPGRHRRLGRRSVRVRHARRARLRARAGIDRALAGADAD